MSTTTSGTATTAELARLLFTSCLQESEAPSPAQVRAAIDERLCACGGDGAACAAAVAQEAGDHPDGYAARMRWALRTVATCLEAERVQMERSLT
ncbi:hypothetical protein [Actinomadura parmotrematis]|uniref:Uncharacterized protein n=1 Tax=Actinomadura parmotrematis TaxID=2864039 RepID=A0ABS7FR77_9ACTN|nr:hypothetical protein [Actinomadura parmotrematis]MBW8482866.1 hypothetical protein [Actinomadura parmotrematis]